MTKLNIKAKSFDELAKNLKVDIKIVDDDFSISTGGEISPTYYDQAVTAFKKLRETFNSTLSEYGLTFESYQKEVLKP